MKLLSQEERDVYEARIKRVNSEVEAVGTKAQSAVTAEQLRACTDELCNLKTELDSIHFDLIGRLLDAPESNIG